jgi:hypothetical protein
MLTDPCTCLQGVEGCQVDLQLCQHVVPVVTALPGENSDIATARRVAPLISNMTTASITERPPPRAMETYEYGDWEEIKEMLTWAFELCDRAWLVFIPILL